MQETINQADLERLLTVGAHYGYSRTRRHPSMKERILSSKNGTDIINVEQTKAELEKAKDFLKELSARSGTVLFVGTKPEARAIIEKISESLGMPYVIERWIGGTFTNWSEIKKRIAKMEDLRGKKERNELDMYTKKERLEITREIGKLSKFFGGLSGMIKLPDAVIAVDSKHEEIAIKEASLLSIPVIAISNTDCDITTVNYPIVANDASRSSISYIIEELGEALKSGVTVTTAS